MLVEVWNKGLIWDKALGYHWIPLTNIQYSNEVRNGQGERGMWVCGRKGGGVGGELEGEVC